MSLYQMYHLVIFVVLQRCCHLVRELNGDSCYSDCHNWVKCLCGLLFSVWDVNVKLQPICYVLMSCQPPARWYYFPAFSQMTMMRVNPRWKPFIACALYRLHMGVIHLSQWCSLSWKCPLEWDTAALGSCCKWKNVEVFLFCVPHCVYFPSSTTLTGWCTWF